MSIQEKALTEMKFANFDERSIKTFQKILEIFFTEWDSGGAVDWARPVLAALIDGKPLSKLTGEDDEFAEVAPGVFQNKRCSSVFKSKEHHDGKLAYDIDNPAGMREPITFPYWPASK